MKTIYSILILCLFILSARAQIQITVDVTKEIKEISPYIYGRNNSLSDTPSNPVSSQSWQLYKEAGVRFFRESGGNNSTKYNWRKKISSHPDWYNNVYKHDWDYAAQSLQDHMPEAQGMWAFQLLGYVAKTNSFNFNDWEYNHSQWTPDVSKNWCGDGDISKYLEPWPADSTAAILTQWFDVLRLNKNQFQYWNMDNEPECWTSTHDDVMPQAISAENYIRNYVETATKARALFPEIKIVGPVFTNEWFWYNWQNGTVPDPQNSGKKYSWVEYFIKRIAEEQQRTGVRLLDVLDFHFYPESSNNRDITLQLYRVFYDINYNYPGANGCKVVDGGWNNSITKEYIFKRSNDWLNQYMGINHGVTMGMSEMGNLYYQDPNIIAVCYASLLGTFAENNVELFAPWDWYVGQWEVLHLYTHYTGTVAVASTSSQNETVSAYSSLNTGKDTLSVVLVNRDIINSLSANLSLKNVTLSVEMVTCYQLSDLPSTETFVSSTQNALKKNELPVTNQSILLTLPKLSVTVVRIPLKLYSAVRPTIGVKFRVYPNPAQQQIIIETSGLNGTAKLTVNDMTGKTVKTVSWKSERSTSIPVDVSNLKRGIYVVSFQNGKEKFNQKLFIE